MELFKSKLTKITMYSIIASISLLTGLSVNQSVHADTSPDVVITPTLPTTQSKDVSAYYSFKWTAGTSQELGVNIQNNTDTAKKFTMKIGKGITNPSGVVVYDSNKAHDLETSPTLASLLKTDKSVVVPPKSTKHVSTSINFPEKEVVGTKIGSWVFTTKGEPGSTSTQSSAYALPIIIKGSESTRNPNVSFGKFSFKRIGSGIYSIDTPVKNKNDDWIFNAKVKTVVSNQDGKIFSANKTMQLTPSSLMKLRTNFNKTLNPGKYIVKVEITSNRGNWSSTQNVVISNTQSKDMSDTIDYSVQPKDKSQLWIMPGAVIFIILVILIICLDS